MFQVTGFDPFANVGDCNVLHVDAKMVVVNVKYSSTNDHLLVVSGIAKRIQKKYIINLLRIDLSYSIMRDPQNAF